jgi:hypothetical protein
VGKLELDGVAACFLLLADVRSPEPELLERLLKVRALRWWGGRWRAGAGAGGLEAAGQGALACRPWRRRAS